MKNMNEQLKDALVECERLKRENAQLKQLLQSHNIPFEHNETLPKKMTEQTKQIKINERIKVFRNLFKGREDVFAVRWDSKDGKTGYSPARKYYENHQVNIPLANQVIYDHLAGKQTIGIYPLLKNNECWFLAVDFDKNNWKQDVHTFMAVS